MDARTYAEVDYLTPMMHLGVAGILVVFGIPLLLHGLFRRRRFSRLRDGEQTWKARSSIRIELLTGGVALLIAAVFGALSWNGYERSTRHLEANIVQRYHPSSFELGYWNGSWATIDITLPDGTRFPDSIVMLRAGSEPFIEDIWYHHNPKL